MRKLGRRRFFASVPVVLLTRALNAEQGEPLFNGRDLSGWHVRNGPESAFYVSDGAIVASPSSAWPDWLSTNREYENFDLSCEALFRGWTDGGIYIHTPEHGRPGPCGMKINPSSLS